MKRLRRTNLGTMKSSKSRALPVCSPYVGDDSMQVLPGIRLVNGCEAPVVGSNSGKAIVKKSGRSPRVADSYMRDSSMGESESDHDVDFNDMFPDEILLLIFKYVWRDVHCWDAAKVCKRWCTLLAYNLLQKRSNHDVGRYPCLGSKKNGMNRKDKCCRSRKMLTLEKGESGLDKKARSSGSGKMLTVEKVESEWWLAMDFMKACKRHTHSLEIKDCTHVSVRGYQLISGFGSNLKSIRLESCNSIDDPSFDSILDRCSSLRSIHLSMVDKLSLRTFQKKVPMLQELQLYGCRNVTASTVTSLLNGCPNLRSLSLRAMGGSHDWDENKIVHGPPLKLQTLELSNTLAVTDGFLRALSKRLCNLRRLDLSLCPLLSDDGLKAISASCGHRLQKLVVTRCTEISDDSALALAGTAASLLDLSLAGTSVSDGGLRALMESEFVASRLRNLSLACCKEVTDAGLLHVVSNRHRLVKFKVLDVQGCPEVSAFGVKELLTHMGEKALKVIF